MVDKVNRMIHFPVPTTITKLKAFLGLCTYYKVFGKDFALVAAPLYTATSEKKLVMTPELRTQITADSFLHIADYDKPFIVDADACNSATAVLFAHAVVSLVTEIEIGRTITPSVEI